MGEWSVHFVPKGWCGPEELELKPQSGDAGLNVPRASAVSPNAGWVSLRFPVSFYRWTGGWVTGSPFKPFSSSLG